MLVVDPGHRYQLLVLDGSPDETRLDEITFVKRQGPRFPGNEDSYPGTNSQEVLRALIDRVKYLNDQIPHAVNQHILSDLRSALFNFEYRHVLLKGRARTNRFNSLINKSVGEYLAGIEDIPVCPKCVHIFCEEHK